MTNNKAKWGGATQNVRLFPLRHAQSVMPGCPRPGSHQPGPDQGACRRPGLHSTPTILYLVELSEVVSESLSKLTVVPLPSREKFGSGSEKTRKSVVADSAMSCPCPRTYTGLG